MYTCCSSSGSTSTLSTLLHKGGRNMDRREKYDIGPFDPAMYLVVRFCSNSSSELPRTFMYIIQATSKSMPAFFPPQRWYTHYCCYCCAIVRTSIRSTSHAFLECTSSTTPTIITKSKIAWCGVVHGGGGWRRGGRFSRDHQTKFQSKNEMIKI